MIIGRRRKRGNGGNELKDTFSGNVCECKKLMSSMAWEWDGEVGAVRAGARANEAFRKVGEEEEKEEEEEEEEVLQLHISIARVEGSVGTTEPSGSNFRQIKNLTD